MKHISSLTSNSNLSGVVPATDIQPNAVDVKLKKVFKIRPDNFIIDEDQKTHRGADEIDCDEDGYWNLEPGSYEIVMENEIEVANGEAGWIVVRSTLNRNGVFVTSGLYDSGYHGILAACLHVTTGNIIIKSGTRIGQYLNFNAETLSKYDGDYGFGKGHDEKHYNQ